MKGEEGRKRELELAEGNRTSFIFELTDGLIDLDIPHIVDDASCSSHDESSQPEESRVKDGSGERESVDGGGKDDSPCLRGKKKKSA